MNETHPSIERIVDYLHGELSPAEDAAIYAHLATCPECDLKRSEELAITEALQAHARATEREMPPGLATRIRSTAASRQPTSWQRLFESLRPALLVPAAAVAVLAIYVGYDSWHRTAGPTPIKAADYVTNH
ncbi:MAG: zf-HC2 domain-containing protein, partial [Candidatus Eremiobacteraeota bacterium]|nr:zf-HC2 domain-containing protein [Candidatus Eremiobacteraeota bacterium]